MLQSAYNVLAKVVQMPKQIADEDILRTTMRLFLERGYMGATTRQIAEEAAINEVTLFRKFGSKADLVAEAVAHEMGQIALDEIRYTGDVAADLRRIVMLYLKAVAKYGEFFPVLLAEIPRYPELRRALRAPIRVIMSVSQILEQYQQDGTLRQEPPLYTVSSLLGPIMVLTMIRDADPELEIPTPDVEAHIKGFLQGHLTRSRQDPY